MRSAHLRRAASLLALAIATISSQGCELRPSRSFAPPTQAAAGPPIRAFRVAPDAVEGELAPPALPASSSRASNELPITRPLANGIMLHALVRKDQPGATVLVVLGVKAIPSPSPTAQLYAQAALDGASPWGPIELDGARLFTYARSDFVGIGISALAPVLEGVVARVVPGVVDAPLLGVSIDAARSTFATYLSMREPERLAHATATVGIFPLPHPYGYAGAALIPEWYRDIPVKDVKAFRDANLVAENLTVIAAGNVDVDSLAAVFSRALADVPRKPIVVPKPAPPAVACAGQVIAVNDVGSRQTNVDLAYRGAPATHADAAALHVLAAAAGGSIATHLNASLRRRLGVTYGFNAELEAMREGSILSVHGALDPARLVEGLNALGAELDTLARTPLAEDELRLAKVSAAHARARLGDTGAALRLAHATIEGVPFSGDSDILAVTAEQLRAAAEHYLAPSKRCLVVVGDATRLERDLRGAGFGPVARAP